MSDFLATLKARRTPVVRDGAVHLPGSGYAAEGADGKLVLSPPESKLVESDDSVMRHRFRISTPAVDRAGDVVLPRGCEKYLDRYRKNPQVFLNHASFGLPIAMSRSPNGEFGVLITDEALYADAYFHGITEESEKVYELIKLGYLNAASIGFRPLKASLLPDARAKADPGVIDFDVPGLCFEEWELLEWSVVGVPCNPEALDGMKSWLGKNAAQDTSLHQALKAMLVEDAGRSVTVTVPAEPPQAAPASETKALDPGTPFSPDEVESALEAVQKALQSAAVTPNEIRERVAETKWVHTWSSDEREALEGRLKALEAKFQNPLRLPLGKRPVPKGLFAKDVKAGEQNPSAPLLLAVPDVRQPNDFTCGAASTMAVGKYFGVGPDTLDEWVAALKTTAEESTHPERIVEYLTSLGLAVEARHNMTIADLRDCWLRGAPVICPVQDYGPEVPKEAEFNYGHYLTVIGVALEHVFCQDSSADNVAESSGTISDMGRIMVREVDWCSSWHDHDATGKPFTQYGIAVYGKSDKSVPGDTQAAEGQSPGTELANPPTGDSLAGTRSSPEPTTKLSDPAGEPKGDLDPHGQDSLMPDPIYDNGSTGTPPDPDPTLAVPPVPPGAKALKALIKMYQCAMEHCDVHGNLVEHPKAAPFLHEHRDDLEVSIKAVHKFGKKHYPDHFPDESLTDPVSSKAAPAPTGDTPPAATPPTPVWSPEALARLAEASQALALAQAKISAQHYRLTGKKL